jgi:phosphoglycolate phosphatase-like HAD superfamily hydrolase
MKKINIVPAFDLDGVVMDSYEIFRKFFMQKYLVDIGYNGSGNHRCFNFMASCPEIKSDKQCEQDVTDALILFHDEILPIPHSIRALQAIWHFFERPLIFITAREFYGTMIMDKTRKWLDDYLEGTPYEIHFSYEKVQFLRDHGVTHYVDDRFKYADELAPNVERYFMINSDWNFGRDPFAGNVTRIDNLLEMFHHILQDYTRLLKI